MELQDIKDFLKQKGWGFLGAPKTAPMYSFFKENKRMNIYFTTGTVTIQDSMQWGKSPDVFRNIGSLKALGKII